MATEDLSDIPPLNLFKMRKVGRENWGELAECWDMDVANSFVLGSFPLAMKEELKLHFFRVRVRDFILKHPEEESEDPPEPPKKVRTPKPPRGPTPARKRSFPRVIHAVMVGVWKVLVFFMSHLPHIVALAMGLFGMWCNMPSLGLSRPEQRKPAPTQPYPDCCEGFRGTGKPPMPNLIRSKGKLAMAIPGIAGEVLKLSKGVHGLRVITQILKVSNGNLAKDITKLEKQVVTVQRAVVSASHITGNNASVVDVVVPQWTGPSNDDHDTVLDLVERVTATELLVSTLDTRSRKSPQVTSKDLDRVRSDAKEEIAKLQSQLIQLQNTMLNQQGKHTETVEREVKRGINNLLNWIAVPAGLIVDWLGVLNAELTGLSYQAICDSATLTEFIKTMLPSKNTKQVPKAAGDFVLQLSKRHHFGSMFSLKALLDFTPTTGVFDPIGTLTTYPQIIVQLVYWTPLADYLPEKWMVSLGIGILSYMTGPRRR